MKYKNKNMGKLIILVLTTIVLSVFYVSALSIGFGSAINIEPGQSVEKGFSIMNTADDAENLVVEVTIKEGSEYITLSQGSRYEVPAGEIGVVPATVTVPASASSGEVYPIKINFNSIEGGTIGGGTLEFSVGHTISFDINVMAEVPTRAPAQQPPETPATEGISTTWIILGIVLIIIVIVLIWFAVKSKKDVPEKPVKSDKSVK